MKCNLLMSKCPLIVLVVLSIFNIHCASCNENSVGLWLNLHHTGLKPGTAQLDALRGALQNRQLIEELPSNGVNTINVIIPIFQNAMPFYVSKTEPFSGRNINAITDEVLLRKAMVSALKAKVNIYLGINVLAWNDSALDPNVVSIFHHHPDWMEISQKETLQQTSEARFASPFSSKVQTALQLLVKEIAVKFPEAKGIVLNLGLSPYDILGFSNAGRAAVIRDLGIDPIDLNFDSRADSDNDNLIKMWILWRRLQLGRLVKSLRTTYLQTNPQSKVLSYGNAQYYQRQEYNDLRMAQDWRYWLQIGATDGVLIEGNWLPSSTDYRYLRDSIEELKDVSLNQSTFIVPVSRGNKIDKAGTYGRDWELMNKYINELTNFGFAIGDDKQLKEAVSLANVIFLNRSIPTN